MKGKYIPEPDIWEDGAEGEWVKCPECGKLFFWDKPIYDWKVAHGYVLLCGAACGKKYFYKHPEENLGVQKFFALMAEDKVLEPWSWKTPSY